MYEVKKIGSLLMSAAVLALTACAGVKPVAYTGIASAPYLQANTRGDSGRIPYTYSTQANWRGYKRIVIEPVAIYRGTDNQFGDMKEADKTELANYMQKAFGDRLSTRFGISSEKGPDTLRLKLILTGAEKTTPFLGQFTHFDIGGNVYNGIAAASGGKSAFGGSVSYAVEIYDSANGRLLDAYVTKQYPNAMNLIASFGSLGAARTGIDKGADALLTRLR